MLDIPVIGSLILTVGIVGHGASRVIARGWYLLSNAEFSPKSAKMMSVTVIETIDLILVGALGYITAVGIYSLFISPGEERILPRVKIEKLVDLEHKIIGALVAALAVALHGSVSDSSEMLDLLYADAGTALVMVALCLFAQISARAETKSQ